MDAVRPVLAADPRVELWLVGEEGTSTKQIKYLGFRKDVPRILGQADAFLYAPRPAEGAHDLAVLEAMAAGLPIVSTYAESVAESVTHGHDGLLVPYGDEVGFRDSVRTLVQDPMLRARLGAAARQTVRARFDARQMARRHVEAYRQIIASWGHG
jgi:glycosyltransferase involved in cell wall biosynthesis